MFAVPSVLPPVFADPAVGAAIAAIPLPNEPFLSWSPISDFLAPKSNEELEQEAAAGLLNITLKVPSPGLHPLPLSDADLFLGASFNSLLPAVDCPPRGSVPPIAVVVPALPSTPVVVPAVPPIAVVVPAVPPIAVVVPALPPVSMVVPPSSPHLPDAPVVAAGASGKRTRKRFTPQHNQLLTQAVQAALAERDSIIDKHFVRLEGEKFRRTPDTQYGRLSYWRLVSDKMKTLLRAAGFPEYEVERFNYETCKQRCRFLQGQLRGEGITWTEELDGLLLEAVKNTGKKWDHIGRSVFARYGVTGYELRNRYKKLVKGVPVVDVYRL